MSEPNPLLDSLSRAIDLAPDDVALRVHLAELLLDAGRREEAVTQLASALGVDPAHKGASELMARALASGEDPSASAKPSGAGDFDWSAAEADVGDAVPPRFVDSGEVDSGDGGAGDGKPGDGGGKLDGVGKADGDSGDGESEKPVPAASEPAEAEPLFDVEASTIRLADVGGMVEVKKRLHTAFLAPMAAPKLRKLFGKRLRGGLLLFGPPGCGKTFLAKAVAGELGARFIAVRMHDILDMWLGNSEKNMHELFTTARENAPCVLFFDELDAVGMKRTSLRHSGIRSSVNQLLTELDGVDSDNEGVFALAATNHPWDIDSALLRPGRFDRAVAVLPPDEPARTAIFEYHLRDRPVAGIRLGELAKRTDGYSGADIEHVCETASERALLDSIETGEVRMIGMDDLAAAVDEVSRTATTWFSAARNVVLHANRDGLYDGLVDYMKKRRML